MGLAGIGAAAGWALALSGVALAAEPVAAPNPTPSAVSAYSFDPARFEIRGGLLASTWRPEIGEIDVNGELVAPKFISVAGWQDALLPRLHAGAMGNLAGGTSYAYAGALWTVNYDRVFAEVALGGAAHNAALNGSDPKTPKLGCRALYHTGANLGYRFAPNWSAMITFDHVSNGKPTLSSCTANTGLSVLGLRIGYSF